MAPNGGGQPTGELADQINNDFGSFDAFKKEMCAKSAAVKGTFAFNIILCITTDFRIWLGLARME